MYTWKNMKSRISAFEENCKLNFNNFQSSYRIRSSKAFPYLDCSGQQKQESCEQSSLNLQSSPHSQRVPKILAFFYTTPEHPYNSAVAPKRKIIQRVANTLSYHLLQTLTVKMSQTQKYNLPRLLHSEVEPVGIRDR